MLEKDPQQMQAQSRQLAKNEPFTLWGGSNLDAISLLHFVQCCQLSIDVNEYLAPVFASSVALWHC